MPETAPKVGEFVAVRGRIWLVDSADTTASGLKHLTLSCTNDDAQGEVASVVWDAEISPKVLSDNEWETLGQRGVDDPEVFSAYLRTLRWNTVTAADRRLFQAPFRAGIKLEAYQLAPLRKALELPRINLLIADDVGLGKTVEAGLVVREMLLRRQVDFILVAAPPSMTLQWKEELEAKFGLTFEIIDREFLRQTRNRRGFAANPWSVGSQFIISHKLLVDEVYTYGLRGRLDGRRAKTMLILDEAHHAAPASGSGYAVDSQFTTAIREIAPLFEHRLFLTATPHNGHPNSFSALLEMLDPQRFTRGIEVRPRNRDAVMIRRLKEDLRRLGVTFPKREVIPVRLDGLPTDTPELRLSEMLSQYGNLRAKRIARLPRGKQATTRLVFCGLQQRLLSSVAAFEKTLRVHRDTLARLINRGAERASEAAAKAFVTDEEEELPLDADEAESEKEIEEDERASAAAATIVGGEGAELAELQVEAAFVEEMLAVASKAARKPDARVEWLAGWIRDNMSPAAGWNDRRLIIFTEYEDTRRWLQRALDEALAAHGDTEGRIETLSGITAQDRRESLKLAFNASPAENPLRILICTDAAREGINLQMRCHDLVHFDLPWNPSRLEQRNGRIDRKLQPSKEVYCRYFLYTQRSIDIVLAALVRKTETIRVQLGSLGKVIEDRISSKLADGGLDSTTADQLAREIEDEDGGEAIQRARRELEEAEDAARLDKVRAELDTLRSALRNSQKRVGVEPEQLKQVVGVALERAGSPLRSFEAREVGKTEAIALDPENPIFKKDATWSRAFDDLRVRPRRRREPMSTWRADAPVREIAFEPPELEDGRFDERVVHVHLEHRLVRRLLSRFITQGFQSGLDRVCVLESQYSEPRVVLLGRISLYGAGAARLHEEIIPVTARWRERGRDTKPLEPLREAGQQTTLEQLAEALKDSREVSSPVIERIRRYVQPDLAALRPELERRANEAEAENAASLVKIGEAEARSLHEILVDQRKRIVQQAASEDINQLVFAGLGLREEQQKKKDMLYWQQRLASIEREIEEEPARLREAYDVKAWRLEPIGLVYLWPRTN